MAESHKVSLERLMPKSLTVIEMALESADEKVAFVAARYVIDQIVGKAVQKTEGEGRDLSEHTAAVLAQTLRHMIVAPETHFDTVEGTIHVLGEGKGALNTSSAYEEFPD